MKPPTFRYLLMALMLVCGTVLTAMMREAGFFIMAAIACFIMYILGQSSEE